MRFLKLTMAQPKERQESKLGEVSIEALCSEGTLYI